MKLLQGIAVAVALAVSGAAFADKDKNKAKGKGAPTFSTGERSQIEAYFKAHPDERAALPPGLAKKGKIPPGWQKKLARGQPVPADIWENRQPVPDGILVKLPLPPEGVEIVRIFDRIVKVRRGDHVLLDEVHF